MILIPLGTPTPPTPFDDTGLKAYWKFNESSGDIINQSESAVDLGSGADIQITGATYSETGKKGNAMLFDGVNDYGDVGTSTSQFNFLHSDGALFTLAYWAKAGSAPATNEGVFVTADGTAFKGIINGFSDTYKVFMAITGSSSNLQINHYSANNYIPDTTNFYFYVFTWDENAGTNNLRYRRNDANLVEVTKDTGSDYSGNASYAADIGRWPVATDYCHFTVDEWSIWNKVMTDADQTSLYNGGAGLEIY